MTNNEAVETLVSSRQEIQTKLQQRLMKAQAAMKQQAGTKHDDITYAVGQWVYVKLKPFCQQSITGTTHPKLSKCFFGPF